MDVRKVGLGVAAAGAVTQVIGFGIDGRLHATDPQLASREGILTLSNLGHLFVFLGLSAIFVGIVAAFAGPRLYRPTMPTQIGRRLAQLSAPVMAMALIGGLGVGANASSLGAPHNHDHSAEVAGDVHIPGDHDHVAAHADHANDGSMDHDNGEMDHGHSSDEVASGEHSDDHGNDHGTATGDDHAHTVGLASTGSGSGHGHTGSGDTHSTAAGHSNDDHDNDGDHGTDHDNSGDHGTDHDNDDDGDGHDHTGTTTGDQHGDHDHGTTTTTPGSTDTTQPHDHDHGTTTTTPGSTDTTQPHDHDHGTTTSTPGGTGTTQPHDHDHTGTTLPGENCTNGSHDHGHLPPVALDPATQIQQDVQLATAKVYAEQYPTAAAAMQDGYVQVTHYLCGIGAHYMKLMWVDETFNPAEPEILLYDGDDPLAGLVGVNYYVGSSSGVAPAGFAGTNDQWHQHIGLCLKGFFVVAGEDSTEEECAAAGGVKQADGGYYWLLHAWVVDGYEMPDNWFNPTNPVLGPGPWDFPGGV